MMQLNVSQVLEYQNCPRRWHNRYISKRAVAPTAALSDGIYWHQLAEAWLKREPLLPQSEGPVQDRMREFVENGGLPHYPVEGTEIKLQMPLGRHTLVGTLDGIMPAGLGGGDPWDGPEGRTMHETFYSLQWKTCAGGQDLDRQCDAVKYSYYEAAYEALMNHAGYPCVGTFLGVYKKLTKGELLVGVCPFSEHILERPAGYVAGILAELESIADEMEAASAATLPLRPNRRSCIMGFNRCQYWSVCYQGGSLADISFEDAEDRYAPTTVEEP